MTEFLRRDPTRGLWCEDSTDYRLPVSPGDELTVVRNIKGGALCKKDGATGWYFGRLEAQAARSSSSRASRSLSAEKQKRPAQS